MAYTAGNLPALTGSQLLNLFIQDGWQVSGTIEPHGTHGISLTKRVGDETLTTCIAAKKSIVPEGTLAAILGMKQSRLAKKGLADLLNRYGVPSKSLRKSDVKGSKGPWVVRPSP